MNKSTPEYLALRQRVEDLRERYYVDHDPDVSDAEYDTLARQLQAMEDALGIRDTSSPSATVGSDLSPGFKKVKHAQRMLSLDNIFTKEEISKFFGASVMLIVEPKIDGLSLNIDYDNGELVRATTRGTGTEGDDVTAQAMTIGSIPKMVAQRSPFSVRGEVYMKRSVFAELNAQRAASGEALFKNPRNAASGSLKQRDPAETAKRKLDFIAYWTSGIRANTDSELIERLAALHFEVTPVRFAYTADAHGAVAEIDKIRESLEYDIDGAVLKIDNLSRRHDLGEGTKSPKWAVAYKFPPEQGTTTLIDIIVTVGKSGQLCPNAVLTPILLAGTTVSAASLMNADEMMRIGSPAIGDKVVISKSGEIIPRVISIAQRSGYPAWSFPPTCPSCGTPIVREGVHYFCPNHELCPAQVEGRLVHAVGKTALDWDGCGPAVIRTLIEKAGATRLVSLFLVNDATVRTVLGGATATKFLRERERVKSAPLWRKIHALGIDGIGQTLSKELAQRYGSLEGILTHLREVAGVLGPITYDSLVAGIQAAASDLDTLEDCGFTFADSEAGANSRPLAGKTFAITGGLATGSRDEVAAKIEARGGLVKNSVGKKLSFLVLGDAPGQNKLADAHKHGVAVISEAELYALMGEPFNPAPVALEEKEY